MAEITKVWITKYAVKHKIFTAEATITDYGTAMAIGDIGIYRGEGQEWHRTKESAIAMADEMRRDAIDVLRDQIKELEDRDFSAGL